MAGRPCWRGSVRPRIAKLAAFGLDRKIAQLARGIGVGDIQHEAAAQLLKAILRTDAFQHVRPGDAQEVLALHGHVTRRRNAAAST